MNLKEMKKGIFYITYALILFFLLYNIRTVMGAGHSLISILFPFILGAAIAFVLSLPMGFFERKLTVLDKKEPYKKWKRPLGLVLTVLIFLAVLSVVILLIIPAIRDTAEKIMYTVPPFLTGLVRRMKELNIPAEELEQWLNDTAINWSAIGGKIFTFLKTWSSGIFVSTYGVVSSVVGVIADVVIAVIFAIYILFSKENLYRQFKMMVYAFVPEKAADKLFSVGKLTHKTFASFFAGQCVEACILGGMFVVCMAVCGIPYAVLIGVLIAVTSLIPIFGAFIGCAVGVLLIVMVDPMKALVFLILFLVIQQVEGNLIYPKVVGGSIGLPGIWVLVAVSVGGSLAGVIGMILFIPLFSVGYALLRDKTKDILKRSSVSKDKYQ
ncbi:MAG: AI-2E family transporter [Lachnospiraceae bacterium]|nr:AI-2E family transporter [Lachnospiraceae bacterium]